MKGELAGEGVGVLVEHLHRFGEVAGGGEVELELDGAAIRIEPVGGSGLREAAGLLLIPASGTPLTAAAVRELLDADRHGR